MSVQYLVTLLYFNIYSAVFLTLFISEIIHMQTNAQEQHGLIY